MANGRQQERFREHRSVKIDVHLVVKLPNPCGAVTRLLIEIEAEPHDIALGLCDLGIQEPELGNILCSN